jgi:hypothetical protein
MSWRLSWSRPFVADIVFTTVAAAGAATRYEVNPEMVPQLEAAGLMFVAGIVPNTAAAAAAARHKLKTCT